MSNNPSIVIGVSAIDTSKEILTSVDSRIRSTTANIEAEGNKINSKFSQISANFKQNLGSILTTAAGLGAGIVGFSASFDILHKAQVGADQANLRYQKSLETLKDVQGNVKSSSADLANAQEDVRIKSEKAALAQDSLHDTYANFLANIPSQMISFGVAASSIYTMIKGHQLSTIPTTVAMATTYDSALASMTVANTAAELSTKNLTLAQRVLQITMGPVGWAILGISTLIVLIATNTFGLRDAFFALGKAIYDFFNQYFKPLADAMKWFYDNVLKPIGNFMGNQGVQSAQAYGEGVANVGVAVKETTEKLNDYDQKMLDLAKDTINTREENLLYLASIGKLGDAVGLTNDRLDIMSGYLRDNAAEEKRLLQSNFELVADTYNLKYALSLTNEELALLAGNLKTQEEYLKTTTIATNELASAQNNLSTSTRSSNDSIRDRAVRAGLIGSGAVETGHRGSTTYFSEPGSRRHAQAGMHEFLNQDTLILAHAGEKVDIAPGGSASSILDGLTFVVNVYGKDAYLEVRDKANRLLKSRRQILAGAGLT